MTLNATDFGQIDEAVFPKFIHRSVERAERKNMEL